MTDRAVPNLPNPGERLIFRQFQFESTSQRSCCILLSEEQLESAVCHDVTAALSRLFTICIERYARIFDDVER